MRTENIKIQNSLQDNYIEPESQSSFDIFRKKLIIALVIILLFCAYSDKIWAQIESLYNSSTEQFAGISTLMSATANNDIDGVRFFSKAGALVINQRNKGGATSLHIACRESNFEIAKILIENGANVNIVDNEGWSPLMRASLTGNKEIVEILLKNGAKAHLLNSLNESALIHATSSKCVECINQIVENGNLIKNMDILVLKSQIADAFLIARSQENKGSQGVLESFLDYASRMAPLVARTPATNDQETLPLLSNQSKISNSKLSKLPKNFVLRNQDNEILTPEQQSVYSVLEDPNLPPISKKDINKKESIVENYQLPEIPQQEIPLYQAKEPKTKYKFKSTVDNDARRQNELAPALNTENLNNKIIKYKTPIQEKPFVSQQISKPEPQPQKISKPEIQQIPKIETPQISKPEVRKFKFKAGQQSLKSKNLNSVDEQDLENLDSSAVNLKDLIEEAPKPIAPTIENKAPNAVNLKKNKITFVPNIKEKKPEIVTQETPKEEPQETIFLIDKKSKKTDKNPEEKISEEAPQETIFLINKKSKKTNKNPTNEKSLAGFDNQEINQQMNQDFKTPELVSEVAKKPNKVFKFKKSSSPQINNSNLENDSIKLAPLEKVEPLHLVDESSNLIKNPSPVIKKFKLKKSDNTAIPIKEIKPEELTSDNEENT